MGVHRSRTRDLWVPLSLSALLHGGLFFGFGAYRPLQKHPPPARVNRVAVTLYSGGPGRGLARPQPSRRGTGRGQSRGFGAAARPTTTEGRRFTNPKGPMPKRRGPAPRKRAPKARRRQSGVGERDLVRQPRGYEPSQRFSQVTQGQDRGGLEGGTPATGGTSWGTVGKAAEHEGPQAWGPDTKNGIGPKEHMTRPVFLSSRRARTPPYPRRARRLGIEGKLLLRAYVQPDGRVGEVRVIRSLFPECDAAATNWAKRKWRFQPGTVRGLAQGMWINVPVQFVLDRG